MTEKKLSDEQVEYAIQLHNQGKSYYQIADSFGVSKSTVNGRANNVLRNRSYLAQEGIDEKGENSVSDCYNLLYNLALGSKNSLKIRETISLIKLANEQILTSPLDLEHLLNHLRKVSKQELEDEQYLVGRSPRIMKEYDQQLKCPVSELELSPGSINFLQSKGLTLLEDIKDKSEKDLRKFGAGKKRAREITALLDLMNIN